MSSSTDEILDRLYAAFTGEGSPDRQLLADAHAQILRLATAERRIVDRYEGLVDRLAEMAHHTQRVSRIAVDRALADMALHQSAAFDRMHRKVAAANARVAAADRFRSHVMALAHGARANRIQVGQSDDTPMLRGVAKADQDYRRAMNKPKVVQS